MTGISEELGRLAELHDRGVLTDDEFQAQKAQLLRVDAAPAAAPVASPVYPAAPAGRGNAPVLILIGLIVVLAAAGGVAWATGMFGRAAPLAAGASSTPGVAAAPAGIAAAGAAGTVPASAAAAPTSGGVTGQQVMDAFLADPDGAPARFNGTTEVTATLIQVEPEFKLIDMVATGGKLVANVPLDRQAGLSELHPGQTIVLRCPKYRTFTLSDGRHVVMDDCEIR